jgi:chromosome segregation ATPase
MSSSSLLTTFGVEETDLRRGEGDWTHIQPVVRRSFAALFEVVARQQSQILELQQANANLRREIAMKPDRLDFERMLNDFKVLSGPEPASRHDIASMHTMLLELRSGLERKASMKYVDEALRRKVDRIELSAKPSASVADMHRIQGELGEIKAALTSSNAQFLDKVSKISNEEIGAVKSTIKDLYEKIGQCPDFSRLDERLRLKANTSEMDDRIRNIAQSLLENVKSQVDVMETVVANHESRLTTSEISMQTKGGRMPVLQSTMPGVNAQFKENTPGAANALSSIAESRKGAQIEWISQILEQTNADTLRQGRVCQDVSDRMQRLELQMSKNVHETRDNTKGLNEALAALGELQKRISDLHRDTVDSIDSCNHSLETLGQRLTQLDSRHEASSKDLSSAHSKAVRVIEKCMQRQVEISQRCDQIDASIISLTESMSNEIKKEAKRAASREELESNVSSLSTKLMEAEMTLNKRVDVLDAKFTPAKDIEAALKSLKQTLKALAETVLQQNARLQGYVSDNEKLDRRIGDTKHELETKITSLELSASRIASLENTSALANRRVEGLDAKLIDLSRSLSSLETRLAEMATVARSLKAIRSASSITNSLNASAVSAMETLASDAARSSRRDEALGELVSNNSTAVPSSGRNLRFEEPTFHSPRNVASPQSSLNSKLSTISKLEELRLEKARLTKELSMGGLLG